MSDDNKPRLWGIGTGPGEPELLTLKAHRLIREADIVFAPKARVKGDSLALDIVKGAGLKDISYREIEFPMITDKQKLRYKWDAAAQYVIDQLGENKTGVFITLGDPGIYSTWTYLQQALNRKESNLKTGTVPGISTMNAAAAALGQPLLTGNEKLALLPLPEDLHELKIYIQLFDTLVIYKVASRLEELTILLEQWGLAEQAALIHRAGLPEEKIFPILTGLQQKSDGYLSTVIIRCRKSTKQEESA